MKKYIAIILMIGVLISAILIHNTIRVSKLNNQKFEEAGYILQSNDQNKTAVDRFYFKANSVYKKNYGDNIEFANTDGEKVETGKNNFIHYTNGSIGAFKNGVLINLNQINDRLITYYNISKKQTLARKNNVYSISHLGHDLIFTSLLWKISDNKYLIASDNINLSLGNDEEKKFIKGFIEIEYQDNEVIKIYNQEISFLTISPDSYVDLQGDIRINLSNRIVSYKGKNKLSIDSMVIDSEDNVDIVDLDKFDESDNNKNQLDENTIEGDNTTSEEGVNATTEDNTQGASGNSASSGENGGVTVIINDEGGSGAQSTSTIINPGVINNGGIIENNTDAQDDEEDEEIVDDTKMINTPEFKVTDFESSPFGLRANITIDDKDALLTEDSIIEILEEETGRKVYESTSALGIYDFELEVNELLPNTNYTLTVSSAYSIDNINYNKNFIYKAFTTKPIGVSLTKDSCTENSISVSVNYEKDANIKSLEVVLSDENGNVIATKASSNSEDGEKSEVIEFNNLNANTEYIATIKNIASEGQIVANGNGESETFYTLKQRPTISNPEFEIDKRNANFNLDLKNVIDPNSGISGYRFEIYDTQNLDEPAMSINTEKTQVTVSVDSETLFRNVGYVYKVIAEFYDNEKSVEYESEFSDIMKLDGSQFPSLSWKEEEISFEKIQGIITIQDNDNAVSTKQGDTIKVVYKDSIGEERTFTTEGSLSIPVDVNNLRKNETYRFSVYAKVDLHDGNDPIDECFIGSVVVKTKDPKNMVAVFSENKNDLQNSFSINFSLDQEEINQGELEPNTLTGITLSIYAGQSVDGNLPSGTPKKVVKMLDGYNEPYSSELREKLYDNYLKITPETFGGQNNDFRDKYYTIVVNDAYDYTDYQNGLPVLRNIYTFETNGYMPDLPENIDDALLISVVRNKDSSSPRSDLDAGTIFAYRVTADFNNVNRVARKYIYKAYDATTNKLIETKEIDVDKNTYEVPSATFALSDGVSEEENDNTKLRRGNEYYFTYEVMVALSPTDESILTHFPEDGVTLKSKNQKAEKQLAIIEMYPLVSTQNTYKIAYRISDIDNAIYGDNIIARVDNVVKSTKKIEKNLSDFNEAIITDLIPGDLEIVVNQKSIFTERSKETVCVSNYFEGINTISNLSFTTELEENKLKIMLQNSNSELQKVLAYKAVFKATDGTEVVKDMLTASENIISIKYSSISELKGKNVEVSLFAYYDTGIAGYQLQGDKYVTYQKPYLKDDSIIYYYQIDNDNNFINSPGQMGNVYTASRNNTRLTIQNQCDTSKTKTLDLSITEQGFIYDGNVVLQKQVDSTEIACSDSNNQIRFDSVITEIRVTNSKGDNDIDTELTSASFYAQLMMSDIITDGKVTIEVYETDENGRTSELRKTITKTTAEFDDKISINDLAPKTYYYLKFKAKFDQNGTTVTKELYDADYNISGKQYYFSTLANVEIRNLYAEYRANSYSDKELHITYNLDKIMGYSAIKYKIQALNEETEEYEDTNINIEPSTMLTNDMEKVIPITPSENVNIKFNQKYKLIAIPIVEIDNEVFEIGYQEREFEIQPPAKPQIIIKAERNSSGEKITANVTVYDTYYTSPNQKYTFVIENEQGEDVTPSEYKDVKYSFSRKKQVFTINDLDKEQDYKCKVIVDIDLENNTHTEKYERVKTKKAVNNSGISVGTITAQNNFANGIYKIKLYFVESIQLKDITQIKYTIYNDSGYIVSGIDSNFTPTSETEEIQSYVIDNNMNNCANGEYYIELQFYKDGTLIDTDTIAHTFII